MLGKTLSVRCALVLAANLACTYRDALGMEMNGDTSFLDAVAGNLNAAFRRKGDLVLGGGKVEALAQIEIECVESL